VEGCGCGGYIRDRWVVGGLGRSIGCGGVVPESCWEGEVDLMRLAVLKMFW